MRATPDDFRDRRRFHPTSGTVVGWVGLGLAALAIALVLRDDRSVTGARFAFAAAVFGILVWSFMLRPRVIIGDTELEMRNPLSSWHVPLADVRRVAVRAVTTVYTDDRHFDGVAVGRPVRSLFRGQAVPQRSVGIPGLGAQRVSEGAAASRQVRGHLDANMTADLLVEQILFAADRARETSRPPGTARRTWAVPEITLLVVTVLGLLVNLFL